MWGVVAILGTAPFSTFCLHPGSLWMDMLNSMRTFVAVVENGSFARAADVLDTTRPVVTNAIKALEASLGVRLLNRTTRRTSLTAEGSAYYDRVSQILDEVAEARLAITGGGEANAAQGRLRIDLPVALARHLIVPALMQFSQQHPGIELMVGVSDNPVDLVAEGIDVVVRIGELPDSSMVARQIGWVQMVTCGAPGYLAQHGVPRSLDDLQAHRAVGFFSGRSRRMMDWQFVLDGEVSIVKLKASVMVNDSDAFIDCAKAGFGLVQVPGISVSAQLQAGALRPVLPDLQVPAKPVSVLYLSKRHVSPQVRAFIEWIAQLFAASEDGWLASSSVQAAG